VARTDRKMHDSLFGPPVSGNISSLHRLALRTIYRKRRHLSVDWREKHCGQQSDSFTEGNSQGSGETRSV